MPYDILIVDDEADIRSLVSGILADEGMTTRGAANSDQVTAELKSRVPHLVLLDIWLQGSQMDGIQILQLIKRDYPHVPVLMISGHGNIETAVSAIKHGAYEFIEKPFKADRLVLLVNRAIEASRLRQENEELRLKSDSHGDLTGKSAGIQLIRQTIEKVAPTNSRILVSGPPGSGKEIVSRHIHNKSKRATGPFVVLNCANMRPELFEIELFGTEPSGPGQPRKVGVFERAHQGTLVLDEVADMPLETQSKIVRVLQEQTFERVGGTTRVQVDVRVISTTNRDLLREVEEGRFRQDLYYRLSVVPIIMPSLADRREDIPTFAYQFIKRFAEGAGLPERTLGDDTMAVLQAYSWPGNVRQLRNVMEWLMIMASGDVTEPIRVDMLPPEITSQGPAFLAWDKTGEMMSLPLREAREMFEREYLLAQVTRFGGNISPTAMFVGMERSALHRKLKMLGVHGGAENDAEKLPEEKAS